MKKILLLLTIALLAACSKDDDSPDVQPTAEAALTTVPMQVAIVFAPGQLGSMCTNDYLLTDVEELANANKDSLSCIFICRNKLTETKQAISDWATTAYGASKHRQRLLILTDPYLTQALEGVQLQATDYVLLLKTRLADAKQAGPAGRTHVLNISYADAVKQAVERRHDFFMQEYADSIDFDTEVKYGPFKVFRLNENVSYADSIVETLRTFVPDDMWEHNIQEAPLIPSGENNDLYGISEEVYTNAYFTWLNPLSVEGELHQPIQFVDYGIFNRSYEWYWISHRDSPWKPQGVIIGEYGNSTVEMDYITPKYDLKSWITRWMARPDNMPEEEWSGKAVFSKW